MQLEYKFYRKKSPSRMNANRQTFAEMLFHDAINLALVDNGHLLAER